ncbi:MAG: hypothetical protein LC800_17210 [Acidobacteria bacterium]|nr:hypothetical protein [Acidobacteriota bacterium]
MRRAPNRRHAQPTRAQAVGRAERLLLRRASPRLLMSLLLLLTGGAGFLCSYALLHAGLARMSVRYPVSILVAYCVFLLLLRVWLAAQGRRRGSGSDFGGGGDFAGGGAGGDWAQPGDAGGIDANPAGMSPGLTGGDAGGSGSGGGLLDSLDFNLDLDLDFDGEGCGVLLALVALVAAAVAGLVVSVYVVYAAPALLAEILVDGLLVAGLYKRMKHVERRHWLRAAVRKTWLPVALTLASFGLAGYAMQRAVPEARSVGEFWRHVTSG